MRSSENKADQLQAKLRSYPQTVVAQLFQDMEITPETYTKTNDELLEEILKECIKGHSTENLFFALDVLRLREIEASLAQQEQAAEGAEDNPQQLAITIYETYVPENLKNDINISAPNRRELKELYEKKLALCSKLC
ncbi:MAG: hypothetical protein O3B09_02885 [Proteobacteria bacterium]|nr:hypothetical protein [Pseudomonadota bacterium]